MDGVRRWLRWVRKLYSLDTLDTRFTVPSNTPPRGAVTELQIDPIKDSPNTDNVANATTSQQDGRNKIAANAPPSLWKTNEFYFYYFIFMTVVPVMCYVPYAVSQPSHPSYNNYKNLLSPGWIPGRQVDNSDGQYAGFRNNVLTLSILLVIHPILRRAYDSFWRSSSYTAVKPIPANAASSSSRLTHGLSTAAAGDTRLEQRLSFDFVAALVLITALHGVSALKILLILYANFKIAKSLPRQYVPGVTWAFNLGILFANELGRGYSFAALARVLYPLSLIDGKPQESMLAAAGTWLDSYGGFIPRWEVLFNFTVLRLISFNMDYCWAQDMRQGDASPIEKKQLDPANLSARDRISIPAKPTEYSFRNYIAYALYSPLYLAGPILTFNDYISQSKFRAGSITTNRTFLYAIRFIICLLTMEIILHYIYTVAIFKAKPDWDSFSPFQLSMLGYFNLTIIWLKLLIPWRFFRLWSLIDGIDPPENMTRCMSNNYSTLAFWRGWHRSFNRWIVRYMFIPMGGSDYRSAWAAVRSAVNLLAVFSFVAIWHDINLRLLQWGWLIVLFLLPEGLATLAFPARKWRHKPNTYRWLCGVGAVGNVLMMMIANLVGFAIGVDGLKGLVHGIVHNLSGWVFFFAACSCLFVGVQVMFETRAQEKREGIKMNC